MERSKGIPQNIALCLCTNPSLRGAGRKTWMRIFPALVARRTEQKKAPNRWRGVVFYRHPRISRQKVRRSVWRNNAVAGLEVKRFRHGQGVIRIRRAGQSFAFHTELHQGQI